MPTEELEALVAAIFARLGLPPDAARLVGQALVAADLEGVASHGVMLVPMYVERLLAGSISKSQEAELVHDGGAAVVLDAHNMLGQLSSAQAVRIAIERARAHGLAAVAVRRGFHFGTAGYWAQRIATDGLVGLAMCNTRPLMPTPGGTERVVGNNPLAIALPSQKRSTFVLNMATSATAMGKIRLAAAAKNPIPEGWAADEQGNPTIDPEVALKGMLLPAAGPKGFGLAAAIDLLCGGLSGGAIGEEVTPLYGDPAVPYGCSHLFLAIDPGRFGVELESRVDSFSERIRHSRPAPSSEPVYAPGDLERARRAANGGDCPLAPEVLAKLTECAARVGVERSMS